MSGPQTSRTLHVLLVEDSPTDADLTREAFKQCGAHVRLHHVTDGIEAMHFLRNRGAYEDSPRPNLILLDLNMPRKDGREVLTEIRSDSSLKPLVVIVLTTSIDHKDVVAAYSQNCNAYFVKPVDLDEFFEMIALIYRFYFEIAQLPD